MVKKGRGISLRSVSSKPKSYKCPHCDRISYNSNDILLRYCGVCKRYADNRTFEQKNIAQKREWNYSTVDQIIPLSYGKILRMGKRSSEKWLEKVEILLCSQVWKTLKDKDNFGSILHHTVLVMVRNDLIKRIEELDDISKLKRVA